MNRIEPAQLAALFQKPAALPAAAAAPGAGFAEALKGALASVDRAQANAQALARRFQANDPEVSLERTMIAMAQANVSFQMLVQTRNKFVQAYQDVMNMQV
jgi:flagellar hook-basal body complex protein FliE